MRNFYEFTAQADPYKERETTVHPRDGKEDTDHARDYSGAKRPGEQKDYDIPAWSNA